MMLKALLFDLDGTLAHTDPIHYQVWQEILQEFGQILTPETYKTRINGRLNTEILQDWLPHLSPEAGKALSDRKEAEFRARAAQHLKPMSGLLPLLDWADQAAMPLGVVTNAPRDNATFMLEVLQLADRFDTVVIADELARGKPDPLPYQVAIAQLQVTAQESLVFEDSPSGIRAAVAAEIATVGIASSQEPELLRQMGAQWVVTDFTDADLQARVRSRQTPGFVSPTLAS
jgi:HAD superfamily hydrolase (TIGR01509 family)